MSEAAIKYADQLYQLASLGETYAFPNPLVAALIVHNDSIIGQGYHRKCGEAHAEVNAIESVKNFYRENPIYDSFLELLANSEIIVSLEPCAHHGKTPSCAHLLASYKFKRLIYLTEDPNPLVAGKGIEIIQAKGIEVIGPESIEPSIIEKFNFLNRAFFKTIKDPDAAWITLKIAATVTGAMVTKPKQITNELVRKAVHRLRSTHQLLVTTINTLKDDNPAYNVRFSPDELNLADIRDPDIVVLGNQVSSVSLEKNTLKVYESSDRKVFEYQSGGDLEIFIQAMIARGYKKIMIEAGPTLSAAFVASGLVDEIVHCSPSLGNSVEQILKLYPLSITETALINTEYLTDNIVVTITRQ